jgi:hypothetical protein
LSEQVDDFLMHYGIPGMKWGKRNARSKDQKGESGSKPKMSRKKKVAIAVGVGSVLVVGAAVAVYALNKNMKTPTSALNNHSSTDAGRKFEAKLRDNESRSQNNIRNFESKLRTDENRTSQKTSQYESKLRNDENQTAKKTSQYESKLRTSESKVSFNSRTGLYENSKPSSGPKAPSPYPMTPLIATPTLDEIIKKYKF